MVRNSYTKAGIFLLKQGRGKKLSPNERLDSRDWRV
jgi:hypothetical protein